MNLYFLLMLCMSSTLSLKSSKNKNNNDEERIDTTNFKCTELKDTIDPNILLHVPCTLVRLTEHLKRCSLNSFIDSLLSIRCSEKCSSGSIKKKMDRFSERLSRKKDSNSELTIAKYKKQAKKLFTILEKSPANLTINLNKDFDCMTFGYSLRLYFEQFQSNHSIRALLSQSDDSTPIDENMIDRQIEYFRCVPEVKSDISFYQYFKYLSDALKFIATNDASSKPELSLMNIAQLFNPFVELNDRFTNILPSHSYLLYMLQNYDKLFTVSTPCEGQKDMLNNKGSDKKKKWKFGK